MNTSTDHTATVLLRLAEVEKRVGIKKSAIYDRISAGTFPAPVLIGTSSRWVESEIEAWTADRVIERDRRRAELGECNG